MKNNISSSALGEERLERRLYSIRVWDLPTRIFHWLLVVFVIVSFITGKIGGTEMQYHELSGFAVLVLVLFRLVWGIVGGKHSRFVEFVRGPETLVHYAASLHRKDAIRHIGHNPLGGWSIIVMLVSALIQAGTGLFANDDILTEGPLYDLISKDSSDWLTGIHHLNQQLLLLLIVIHICAVIFYLVIKGDNLLKPMITGTKLWNQNIESSHGSTFLAVIILAIIMVAGYLIIY